MEPLLELTESLHRAGLPGGGALPHLGSELLRVFPSHLQNQHCFRKELIGRIVQFRGRGRVQFKGLSSWVYEPINFLNKHLPRSHNSQDIKYSSKPTRGSFSGVLIFQTTTGDGGQMLVEEEEFESPVCRYILLPT